MTFLMSSCSTPYHNMQPSKDFHYKYAPLRFPSQYTSLLHDVEQAEEEGMCHAGMLSFLSIQGIPKQTTTRGSGS